MTVARTPLVAGNWKMNTTVPEGLELARTVAAATRPAGVEVALLPPFTHLWPVHGALRETGVLLGAQDAFWEDSGAFTGEVSPAALDGWCDLVLVGHSERRHLLGESDAMVARKVSRCLAHPRLRVIVAVGELLEERDRGETEAVVERQLGAALRGLDASQLARCVVAYEPVWAIGSGRTATPDQAQAVCAHIRAVVGRDHSAATAVSLQLLYGGSVTGDNAAELFTQPDVDGALVGGASLQPLAFAAIVDAAGRRAEWPA